MNEMVYININEASKIVSNKSVSEQLRNFDCDLIRRYKGCLCAMVQAFRSAGFSDMDIIMGFRSIGVELSPKYIRMNSFAHINMDKAIISYFRCGYMYAVPSKWIVNVKKELQEDKQYISPLFPYAGNKLKLLPELFKLFPKDIENLNFIDLFGGSAVVALNTTAKRVLINEGDRFLVSIYEGLSKTPPQKAWGLVESIIDKYHLTPTDKTAFENCRDAFNEIDYEERLEKYWYWGLCLVYFSFSSNTVRHNDEFKFMPTFGMGRASMKKNKEKFLAFAEKLYNGNYSFYTAYYKYMTRDGIPRNEIFFYADPPYLISKASYNKDWDEDKEIELYEFLESCHRQELRWMLSNVTHNNGKENKILIEWLEKVQEKYKGEIHVYYLDRDYKFCNYQRKNAGKTVEIVVTNYK